MTRSNLRLTIVLITAAFLLPLTAAQASAQGKSDKAAKKAKQELKQLNKEANKVGAKAEETANQLGRNVVFCILAAHTSGVGTAQELRTRFEGLTDFPFGQFVAAVLLADRIDETLESIIADLVGGMSIGQITKAADVNMGEVRSHFGQFRSELARSQTTPPTKNCFESNP